jgi:hypothetical protein
MPNTLMNDRPISTHGAPAVNLHSRRYAAVCDRSRHFAMNHEVLRQPGTIPPGENAKNIGSGT